MGPIRSVDHLALQTMAMEDIRPIMRRDFDEAFHQVRSPCKDPGPMANKLL